MLVFERLKKSYTEYPAFVLLDIGNANVSIDKINDIKEKINELASLTIDNHQKYIFVVTAGAYELVQNEICIDVTTGENVSFNTYEEYKAFIYKTRRYIEQRNKK